MCSSDLALAMPGVIAVLTGADVAADGIGGMSCSVKRKQRDGSPMVEPPYSILALGAVHQVGRPVAAVIAETLAQANDAAEAVEVDYTPQPVITDTAQATEHDAARVWAEVAGNEGFYFTLGDRAKVEQAFADAAHTVSLDYVVTRVSANPMEPRAAIGFHDAADGKYTLYAGVQSPHRLRSELATNVLRIPEGRLRVISPDMATSDRTARAVNRLTRAMVMVTPAEGPSFRMAPAGTCK